MSSANPDPPRATDSVLPQLPRAQWESHPNFPRQTLLLGSHINFRRISRYIIDHVSASTVSELRRLYRRWMMAMRGHEAYEERKLYPFLAERFGVDFGALTEGHEALHEHHDAVFHALSSGDDAAIGAALEAHDAVLVDHLALEEDQVIPLLLSLSREEFLRFVGSAP